jgi:mannose-1-phosphate guanylyltransferase/mannose-6-phosphate isomerase
MAGGQGERLWPLSTARRPKQFQRLLPGQASPFEQAFERALALTGRAEDVWTVTRRAYVDLVRQEVPIFERKNILAEPCQRNTAPCIALSAALISRARPAAETLVVMPSDHHVSDSQALVAALGVAVAEAGRTGSVVCLGVPPASPHTGYGYIEVAGQQGAGGESLAVRRFTEKPGEERAREFAASGRHYWNAGIFVWPLETLFAEFARHAPALACFMEAVREAPGDPWPLVNERFGALPEISVDYAVMERTDNIRLVPLTGSGWSDLGGYAALAEVMGTDGAGNALSLAEGGRLAAEEVRESLVHLGSPRQVALCGLKDMIVAETPEALLVCPKALEGRIKGLGRRAASGAPAEQTWDVRPWGSWERLARGPGFQVKRLTVKPGHRLSLQAHRHRAEHWVVLAGGPLVEVDGRSLSLSAGEHVFIPLGGRHRLSNPGAEEVVIIEVQLGEPLAEEDIVRFEDDYGRSGR